MEKLMRADQMQRAAKTIVAMLGHSDILDIIRQCRVAAGDKKHASLAKLGHAGAVLMESAEKLDGSTLLVLKKLHLETLTSPGYWRNLLAETTEEKARQDELVRLYSRVLFASNHLPSLLNMISSVSNDHIALITDGEQILTIKLTDAGEKASDPDRLARSIDGIDMLYSACASLSKKPAMDLQLVNITGQSDRDIKFRGDVEAIQAVKTIIESIPDAIFDIDPEEEIDIQHLVQSLPIFDDLKILQKLGTYTTSDLQDIRDTMHQGVLLSLESGVVLVYTDNEEQAAPLKSTPDVNVVKAVPSLSILHAEPKSNTQANTQANTRANLSAAPNQNIASVNEKLAQGKLAQDKLAQDKLAQDKLAQDKLAQDKLAQDKLAQDKLAQDRLAQDKLNSTTKVNSEKHPNAVTQSNLKTGASVEKDEFYDQYLKERERLQSGAESHDAPDEVVVDKRDSAINNLLRGLKK